VIDVLLRAATVYLAFYAGMFLLGRLMHRETANAPEKRTWQEDSLNAVWIAWLFAALPVTRMVAPRFAESMSRVFAAAVIGALPLAIPHWLYRKRLGRKAGETPHA
jgi:predicted membrane-bound mannosyltransferase